MFVIPEVMTSHWAQRGRPKATASDIAMIEAAVGAKLAAPYVEFVRQFGFVVFDDIPGMRDHFDYAVRYPDRMEVHTGNIGFMFTPVQVIKSYEGNKLDFPEDGWPRFPSNYLKIANSAGQDAILLELGGDHLGRVWYWPENADAWGRGTNTMLGFVAENFYDFINRLRPWVEA
jgi:hypothetical protein